MDKRHTIYQKVNKSIKIIPKSQNYGKDRKEIQLNKRIQLKV